MNFVYKRYLNIFVLIILCTLSMGYAAFGSEMSISSVAADVRIESNVRITGVSLKSSNNGGINYIEYDEDSILGNVNLKSSTSTVTLQVSVTNFGNEEMGIWDITCLPDNLYKVVSGYEMKTKLCDDSGLCSLGSITTFDITLAYDLYDAVTKDHEFRLDFEFRKMHRITYTGIINNGYPDSVIDGGNLLFTATRNIPPKIVAYNSIGAKYDTSLYSYNNFSGVFTFENIYDDINLKYQEKAYLKVINTDIYFKESSYKTTIDSVNFVNYVDTSNALMVWDLSEVSGSNDVVGWVTSGNDLYIGSDWKIYSKSLDRLFYGMSGIKEINFNNINTSETTNMNYLFRECSGLTSLDVSSFDTSKVKSMASMFYGINVSSLDVSNFNTNNVTLMHSMFSNMLSLTGLDLSSFNTENVTRMDRMFYNSSSLASVNLVSFNTGSVLNMSEMFRGCSSLETLDLTTFDTSNVTNMAGMFYSVVGLEKLNVKNFDTSNVTDMSEMFRNVRLVVLDLTSFDTSKVTNMASMFHTARLLEEVKVSDLWNTSNVTNSTSMFASCGVSNVIYV